MAPETQSWVQLLNFASSFEIRYTTDMRIGIDISQIAHEGTGVANYVRNLVRTLVATDKENTYVLFAASLRKRYVFEAFYRSLGTKSRVTLRIFPIPPTLLDILWNILHIVPVEWFIGNVDVFWSSDWTQPPLSYARGITTIHDLTILRFPRSFNRTIRSVQKRKLRRSISECSLFLCDSEATKKDAGALLHIDNAKMRVVYPGFG
jgi:hypothetical protein